MGSKLQTGIILQDAKGLSTEQRRGKEVSCFRVLQQSSVNVPGHDNNFLYFICFLNFSHFHFMTLLITHISDHAQWSIIESCPDDRSLGMIQNVDTKKICIVESRNTHSNCYRQRKSYVYSFCTYYIFFIINKLNTSLDVYMPIFRSVSYSSYVWISNPKQRNLFMCLL